MVRRTADDKISFEVGAFEPSSGTFYILEDGCSRLQLLVQRGHKAIWKKNGKKDNLSWWTRRLKLEEKLLEYVVRNSKSIIALDMKVSPEYFRLMKEFEKLNKESDR